MQKSIKSHNEKCKFPNESKFKICLTIKIKKITTNEWETKFAASRLTPSSSRNKSSTTRPVPTSSNSPNNRPQT